MSKRPFFYAYPCRFQAVARFCRRGGGEWLLILRLGWLGLNVYWEVPRMNESAVRMFSRARPWRAEA